MTAEEAIKLLHPATTAEALAEIECYGGFNGKPKLIPQKPHITLRR